MDIDQNMAEPLDRMFILTETFNLYVRDHPAVLADPDLSEGAAFLSGALLGFYSRLGGSGSAVES